MSYIHGRMFIVMRTFFIFQDISAVLPDVFPSPLPYFDVLVFLCGNERPVARMPRHSGKQERERAFIALRCQDCLPLSFLAETIEAAVKQGGGICLLGARGELCGTFSTIKPSLIEFPLLPTPEHQEICTSGS